MSKSPLQSPYQAFLSLLARYATFLRYCVVGALASGVFYGVANLSALLLQVDSRGSYSASAECMDCHAANAARNDKNNPSKKVDSSDNAQALKQLAQDSSAFTQNAQNLETPEATNRQLQNASKQAQDSRILELQIGVFQGSQGDKTSGLSTKRADEIHDFSPKAESSNQISTQNLATLLGSLASFIFGYFAQMRLAFRAYPNHSTMLPRYLIVLALIALYAQIIAYLGAFFTLSYYLISAFIALSVPLFSYPLQKLWVFAGASKGGGGATT
ncbi:GtrA family protein [Helicobacter sp. XJK30-2]|uniref:GtrA family protein n=1 Tax=Helicobacter zhangjianzhongii TaxID=2974574 RepID=A0ACC6FSA4_9HELI|nr:hypothetical protein [Helicobacter sp. XJK30-2]MDL0082045.1 GtrA family protein [Helicobacter sp. XJK30-2]